MSSEAESPFSIQLTRALYHEEESLCQLIFRSRVMLCTNSTIRMVAENEHEEIAALLRQGGAREGETV